MLVLVRITTHSSLETATLTLLSTTGERDVIKIVEPETNVDQHDEIVECVDVAMLPKSLGGEAVTVDRESGEEDDTCSKGFAYPKLSNLRSVKITTSPICRDSLPHAESHPVLLPTQIESEL